jgi:hypothetical protein
VGKAVRPVSDRSILWGVDTVRDGDAWSSLARATGWTGLATLVLLFAPIIAISSTGEPPLEATSEDAAEFFSAIDVGWAAAAEATASLAMVVLLWFVVGFALLLRRAEGEPAWRATVALVSGVLLTAYGVLDASWDAAAHRSAEIDEPLAGYAFDVGNIGFANAWLAMASLSLATGWVVLRTGWMPRWLGYAALVSAAGLVVARYLWSVEGVWFAPYAVFWVWVVAACVRLIRRPA